MSKENNVIKYYVLCNKLKNIIRTGWLNWNVQSDRLESVAEHIYSTQMLAIAMYSEFNYDIDLKKVLMMLSIHEIEEIIIGDLTMFDISQEEKEKLGHEAISKVLNNLVSAEELKSLILEFDERKTKEALFAFYCDKLECDLQCKVYDEKGCVDIQNQESNNIIENERVKRLLTLGMSWSEMWLNFSQEKYDYDGNFKSVSDYALTHKITEF